MKVRMAGAVVLLVLAATAVGAAEPSIRFPVGPPSPAPAPDAVMKLTGSSLYVIDGDTNFLTFTSPKGLVRVTKEVGPLKIRGVFADGNGKPETRLYKGKCIAVVEPLGKGTVELIVVQEGAKSEAEAITKTLEVDGDGGEDKPKPQPKPQPDPPAPVTPQKLFVVIIEETAEAVANRGAMLADKTLNDRMNEKGHRWRVADQNVVDATGKPPADLVQFLTAAKGKKLPQLFFVDQQGHILKQLDLPATAAGVVTEMQKVGG